MKQVLATLEGTLAVLIQISVEMVGRAHTAMRSLADDGRHSILQGSCGPADDHNTVSRYKYESMISESHCERSLQGQNSNLQAANSRHTRGPFRAMGSGRAVSRWLTRHLRLWLVWS